MGPARRRAPLHHRRWRPEEVTIHIDDKELSLAEFGRMLTVHAGWGMRIAFVPEEFITENPKVEIRKPKRQKR